MSYAELSISARGKMGEYCRACPVCDGRACGSKMPGPGAKGSGTVAIRNYDAWQQVLLNMDTIYEPGEVSCATNLFGHEFSLPVMVGPVGDVNRHYGPDYDTVSYNRCVLTAASEAGSVALTGDGMNPDIMRLACELIGELGGAGIPTIKPWSQSTVMEKLELAKAAHPIAIAMDVDAAGLPFLKGFNPPAGAKSQEALAEVVAACEGIPFIVKGVMTPWGAEKAAEAGASAIVVSNHGGRVLDGTFPPRPRSSPRSRTRCAVTSRSWLTAAYARASTSSGRLRSAPTPASSAGPSSSPPTVGESRGSATTWGSLRPSSPTSWPCAEPVRSRTSTRNASSGR